MASRSFAPWLQTLVQAGYKTHLIFLALPNEGFAIQRVAARVLLGGHDIPQPVIRRRFRAGLANLFKLYMPMSSWTIYDNSAPESPELIAEKRHHGKINMINLVKYQQLEKGSGDDRQ